MIRPLHNGRFRVRLGPRPMRPKAEHTVCVIELDHRPPTLTRHVLREETWSPMSRIVELHGEPPGDNWMIVCDYADNRMHGDIRGVFTAPLPAYIGLSTYGFYQCEDTLGRWFDGMYLTAVYQHDPTTDTYVEMEP